MIGSRRRPHGNAPALTASCYVFLVDECEVTDLIHGGNKPEVFTFDQ